MATKSKSDLKKMTKLIEKRFNSTLTNHTNYTDFEKGVLFKAYLGEYFKHFISDMSLIYPNQVGKLISDRVDLLSQHVK